MTNPQEASVKTLQEEFSNINIGEACRFRNLTLFPFLRRNPQTALDYLLLEDGIAQGKVRVSELQGHGSVPELQVANFADLPVLLVDGEELIGAKQNRVLNLTILVPAKSTISVPVSCVEAGRWKMTTPCFQNAPHIMYSRARGDRVSQVTQSMRFTGTRTSDQTAVWDDIAEKAASLRASSPTGAMSAIYERHASSIEEFARAFASHDGQHGLAFAIGDDVGGLDIFDHSEVLRRFFPKLIRSYALDALDAPKQDGEMASTQKLIDFITQLQMSQSFSDTALGLGKDVRFVGSGFSGAALWAQERYVHICAFRQKNQTPESRHFWTRFTRPSRRSKS
jgi:hypothetical protein